MEMGDPLAQAQHPVGHSQSLDPIATPARLTLPAGVDGIPGRVQSTPLDLTATGQLAFRLTRTFGLHLTANSLLEPLNGRRRALNRHGGRRRSTVSQRTAMNARDRAFVKSWSPRRVAFDQSGVPAGL
jgi:hypothetical protein